MLKKTLFSLLFLLLAACASHTVIPAPNTSQAVLETDGISTALYVEPAKVFEKQAEFEKKLKATGTDPDKRALYEEYIGAIGANGVLDGIENVYEGCHSQAHDAGKVIFSRAKDISTALRICGETCYTGCMHGVLMEVFKGAEGIDGEKHIDPEKVKPLLHDICLKNTEMEDSYGAGECAHGVGHAMMFLSGYYIPDALKACAFFDDKKMEYYCADGAYMEYDVIMEKLDAKESLFYPCDTFAYPATCMRTKVGLVGKKLDKVGLDLVEECKNLSGNVRLGCFHGIGTAHSKMLARGLIRVKELCVGTPDEQTACIEGAAEFMGKYFPENADSVCSELDSPQKEICFTGVKHKLYSLEKDLSLYLS
jgi:hypothetical protein